MANARHPIECREDEKERKNRNENVRLESATIVHQGSVRCQMCLVAATEIGKRSGTLVCHLLIVLTTMGKKAVHNSHFIRWPGSVAGTRTRPANGSRLVVRVRFNRLGTRRSSVSSHK